MAMAALEALEAWLCEAAVLPKWNYTTMTFGTKTHAFSFSFPSSVLTAI